MRKILQLFLFIISLTIICDKQVLAQPVPSWTSAEMYLALRKLNVLGSVLYVAAHPDDENTRLITYFSKDKLYRTGYLSMTRGDGGQNLIGDEQGVDLGLIRTQELLAARRVDGGEQFFTRAYDFGYSKNPEETFTKWPREKILADVVWVIRRFQPDVIITRFPTTGEGGHGHHTASAILANEAFTAAANPAMFPEQLPYVRPWQVKRVLWNSFNFGGSPPPSPDQFRVDVGGYNPLLGKSYGEIAAISRSNHKSQGFGATSSRGEAFESFRTTSGTPPEDDLLDGVETSWKRVEGGAAIEKTVNALLSSFDFLHPEKSIPGLVNLYKQLNSLPPGYWRSQKLEEVKELIAQCSGLFMDVTANAQYAVQTDSIRFNFVVNNRLGVNAHLEKISIDGFDSSFNAKLGENKNLTVAKTVLVSKEKAITQPYWLAHPMEEGYFSVADQKQIGQPDVDPAYVAEIIVNIEGHPFHFKLPARYRFTDPVKGEVYQPLYVLPAFNLKVKPDVIVNSGNQSPVEYEWLVTSNKAANQVTLKKEGSTETIYNSLSAKNQVSTVGIPYTTVHPGAEIKDGKLKYPIKANEKTVENIIGSEGEPVVDMFRIQYDHIPAIVYFKNAHITRSIFNYSIYGKKIGYIIGAGDKVPEALEQMGYEVHLLTAKELAKNNLQQYDAILTGVRAYNTNEWMNNYYDKLMKYVNEGGNLIVQYNTSSNLGPVRAKIGPYKFDISRTRITDENAPVYFSKPAHPVFNFPNKISGEDFKGWVQERSIYHASAWDSTRFESVISMNDPGEKPDDGALIIARHGKGVFVYTGLVFFRQLPAGVPGAYRLLANIIALNRKKGF